VPSSSLSVTHNAVTSSYTINVDTTVTESAGGSYKEGIESIRLNAPIQFASQQRMVTAEDYKAQISTNYSSYLDDVSAWGGADNVPVTYGKVFVGLKFKDSISSATKQVVKDGIKSELTDNLAIMSIDTEFSDPISCYLEIDISFNFDPDLTNKTIQTTQSDIMNIVNNYFKDNLQKFEKVFRRSNLISLIDDLDIAILNSRADVKMQLRLGENSLPKPLSINISQDYELAFPTPIAVADDVHIRVESSRFTYNSRTCNIKNKLSSNVLQIYNSDGEIEVDNIGSFDAGNGTINLVGFKPSAIEGSSIKFSAVPSNESTIAPLRNYILELDTSLSSATGAFDYQNTKVTL